jgi:hypothetical protein
MVDPVYALELTGGPSGQEDDPDAFRERFDAEQLRRYEEADGGHEFWSGEQTGVGTDGQNELANSQLGPHTGASYDHQELGSADDRREALPDIEQAVAEGKPVPVNVEGYDENGDRSGHQMMIIGQEGDKLQIYNPWGSTTWVSEDDFVNGHMGKASDSRMPDAYAVHMPSD